MNVKNTISLAIVVVTHKRLYSFKRLVNSILKAKYPTNDIPLIISIDYHKDNILLIEFANSIVWKHGELIVKTHERNLGLRNHILKCGSLVELYDNIILLEDDLFVSPYFYNFCLQSLYFYQNNSLIAGISLYSYEKSEITKKDFKPVYNEYDVYFMQFPSSWGQLWSRHQWNQFIKWYELNKLSNSFLFLLPKYISDWPETSWKKYFAAYMVQNDKYFVYPKIGLSTNFGESGENYIEKTNNLQTNILSQDVFFKFEEFDSSSSKYDISFELTYESLILLNYKLTRYPKFTIDFYNVKNIDNDALVMTQLKSVNPIVSFSNDMQPLINNLIYEIEGDEIVLTKAKDIIINRRKNILKKRLKSILIKLFNKIFAEI